MARAVLLLALLMALAHGARSMEVQAHEMMCVACNATQFCSGGASHSCPLHSLATSGAAAVHDCVCVPGFQRTAPERCDAGQPPHWYENNHPHACPAHSRTTVERADSVRWCVCAEGFAGPAGGPCAECQPGTFNEGVNATRCESCAPGSTNTHTRSQARTDCRCGQGQHDEGSVGPDGGPCTCDAGWDGPAGACTRCRPGTYKRLAGDAATAGACLPCEAGTYVDGHGAAECLPCGAHSQPNADASACLCDAGYTGDPAARPACQACAANSFKPGSNQDACEQCVPNAWAPLASPSVESCLCNKGYQQALATCTACEPGTYKDHADDDTCASCPANADSPSTSVSRAACVCNAGHEGQHGQDCAACTPGKFWRQLEGGSECAACGAGTFQAGEARTSCDECIQHSHSGPGTATVLGCTCNAGFVREGQDPPSCVACGVGTFESGGQCRQCASGTFAAAEAAVACVLCPAGSTHSAHHTHCVCAKGFTCREGGSCTSGDCVACADNFYQPDLVDDPTCTPCPQNAQSAQASTAQADCLCNVGYYATAHTCTACAPGSYSDTLDADTCAACAGGFISAEAQSACTPCPAHSGTYSTRVVCTCDPGFSRDGGSCVSCLPGTYKAQDGDHACLPCPAFTASEPGTAAREGCRCLPGYGETSPAVCEPCPADSFKEATANAPCTACGTSLVTAASSSRNMSDCVCGPGAVLGAVCEACLANTYKPDYGNGSCTECKADSVTLGPGTEQNAACLCNPGYSGQGLDSCVMCVPGKHKAATDNSACRDCTGNHFAYNEGQAHCAACPGNSSTHGQEGRALCDCVLGYERRWDDWSECQRCREGTFKTDVASRNCTACASCGSDEYVHTLCSAFQDTACTPCAANSWLEAGQQARKPCYCNAGWELSPTAPGSSECQACRPGTFRAEDRDNAVPCAPCVGGWAGGSHSVLCQPWRERCAAGSFVAREGNATHDIACAGCAQCVAGYYTNRTCATGRDRTDTECVLCEAGFVCADGGDKTPCRDNAMSGPGSSNASACACVPGFREHAGRCTLCEVDAFCIDGVQRPCPAHSITLHPGSAHVLDCNCRHGFYRLNVTALAFECRACTADDWCFNNSAYNCSDDRMETGDLAWHPGNCTCVSGWYNTNFSTAEVAGRCALCPGDAHCEHGLLHTCPSGTWTQGRTGTMEASGCKCLPGTHRLHGACAPCPWHHFCAGDDAAVACHANSQTDAHGRHSVEQCLCGRGYEPRNASGVRACAACAPEQGHQQDGFYKDWAGNAPCRPCVQCMVATDRVFLREACSQQQNARCGACDTCLENTTFVGRTVQDACLDRVDTVCRACSECVPDEQFQLRACTETADTACPAVSRAADCGVGWFRGGHTAFEQSSCAACALRGPSAPSRFTTTGLRYGDARSCRVACLGYAALRNTSDHSWGCETCETGNVLLKTLAVAVDGEGNQVNCSFECRPGAERAGDDCVMAGMRGHRLALEVVAFSKTATGFTFDVHHSNFSRFVLVAGPEAPAAPEHCDLGECCWRGLWRVSTLHQMGLLRAENCSASPALLSTQLTPSTLRFELPEARLEAVARCAPATGEVAGRSCVLTLSLLDVVHRRLQTQTVRLHVHRADSHTVHLRGPHTYVPLAVFSVDVALLFVRNASTVYSVVSRMQASEWPVRVSMRVRDMQATELSAAETPLCSRFTAALNASHVDAELAPHEARQLQSYWVGSPGVLHAFYTLALDVSGEGGDPTRGDRRVMDVAAVRNTQGLHPVCATSTPEHLVGMGAVRAAAGLGARVVADMADMADMADTADMAPATHSTVSSPGELGHLLTLVATASDAAVRAVVLQGLLAVYVRGQAARDFVEGGGRAAATVAVRGRLDFTREFRRWCNAVPQECVYEYVMPWGLYGNVRELQCAGAADPAAQAWIRQSFGAVHDGGHVAALCRLQQAAPHRSLALLVHGMRFLSRATGGWGRDVVFGREPQEPYSVFWPQVKFET